MGLTVVKRRKDISCINKSPTFLRGTENVGSDELPTSVLIWNYKDNSPYEPCIRLKKMTKKDSVTH